KNPFALQVGITMSQRPQQLDPPHFEELEVTAVMQISHRVRLRIPHPNRHRVLCHRDFHTLSPIQTCLYTSHVGTINARTLLQRHAYNITMTRSATLTFGDKKLELPVIEGSEGELGVDITRLRSATGLITYDPAFGNTGACKS